MCKAGGRSNFFLRIYFFIGEAAAPSHSSNRIYSQHASALVFCFFFLCHSVPSQTLQPKYFFPLSHFLTLLLTSLAFLLFPLFFLYFSTNVILTYINLLEFSIFIPCVLVMTLICCLVTTFLNYVMEKMTFPLDICSTMELLFVPKNVNRGTISTYFCITMMTRYSKV